MSEEIDLAGDRLAKICRHLEASGHMKGTSGCASMRFGDLALVTPSGYLKAELTGRRDLFLVCVSSGEVLEPPRNDEIPRKLTDSWEVVKMIYEKVGMSERTCVLHSHHEALALAANIDERRLSANASPLLKWRAPEDQEMLKGIRGYGKIKSHSLWVVESKETEGVDRRFKMKEVYTNQPLLVPIIRNTPHEKDLCPELGRVLDDTQGSPPAVLVENHGLYVWGKERGRLPACFNSLSRKGVFFELAQYAVEEAKLVRPAKIPRICRGDLLGLVLLFDVEGTTTPITFVKDKLFPLARDKIDSWLASHWDDKEGAQVRKLLPAELQGKSSEEVAAEMKAWIAADRKEPALKTAQGLIWRESYETGALRAPMFSDVRPCWEEWQSRGARIAIFSSGSREAQQLIYKYCYDEQTPCMDMTRLISCYFDPTSVGGHSKQTPEAYQQIALSLGVAPRDIFFFTDIPGEARAAKGSRTAVVVREGNAAVDCVQLVEEGHQVAESFDDFAV
ncbi:Methylthioribulose-1-phosphate dehydratase [Perkinsus olseni]|uniref:Methylthioribulose-1-phosphate dehydratase n=1 Tax=Perkinsus olseni TaxID=32597 RepID=A0A7J6PF01_PEROL|nr:Methylthioribulose-1-phosphate dehydratase [Perkinsus olseni]